MFICYLPVGKRGERAKGKHNTSFPVTSKENLEILAGDNFK
jgi:hypothetical protein